jgi:hypothetical protein
VAFSSRKAGIQESYSVRDKGLHVSLHLPSFLFRQHERNKGSHRRSLAAILQNPEQFSINSSGLPILIGETSR